MNKEQLEQIKDTFESDINKSKLKALDYENLHGDLKKHYGSLQELVKARDTYRQNQHSDQSDFIVDCILWLQFNVKQSSYQRQEHEPESETPGIDPLYYYKKDLEEQGYGNPDAKNPPKPTKDGIGDHLKEYIKFARIAEHEGPQYLLMEKNRVYQPIAEDYIKEQVAKYFPEEPNQLAIDTIEYLSRLHKTARTEFDQDKMILNCKNCFVDLRTGEKTEPKNYKSLIQIPTEWNPDLGETTIWIESVKKTTSENWEMSLEFFACGLSRGAINPGKALILTGAGSNGKSTMILPLAAMYGEPNNVTSKTLYDLMDKHEVIKLEGKFANISAEIPENILVKRWDFIKKLISQEPISARDLYQSSRDITSHAQMIFAVNELPDRPKVSNSIDSRFIIVECKNKFEHNESFKQSLQSPEERSRILNTLVRVHREILEHGKKMRFTQAEEDTNRLWTVHDTEQLFIDERIKYSDGSGHGIEDPTMQQAFQAYVLFAQSMNRPHLTIREFNKRIRDQGYEDMPVKGRRVWRGMALFTPEPNQQTF